MILDRAQTESFADRLDGEAVVYLRREFVSVGESDQLAGAG